MSRIDTPSQFASAKARIDSSSSNAQVENKPGLAGVRGTFALRAREAKQQGKTAKLKKLASALNVLDVDFDAFTSRNNHDMVDEIKNLIVLVRQHKQEEDDEVLQLCDIMLSEHLRRMLTIPTLSSADGLWKVGG